MTAWCAHGLRGMGIGVSNRMRNLLSFAGVVALAVALVACSGGREKPRTSYEGENRLPPVACTRDPREFAEAEKIRDFDNGRGCGVSNAWRLYSVNGVKLSQPTVVNCAVANTFAQWIDQTMQPAAERRFGARVTELTVPAGYSCRTRNNVRGAKLSEHAHGNAIDVSGFRLEGGEYITVEQGWFASRSTRKFLSTVHAEACGQFTTVLGPAEAHHKDHFHFDLQRHRNGGAYCR
jgi:hypothetical protein